MRQISTVGRQISIGWRTVPETHVFGALSEVHEAGSITVPNGIQMKAQVRRFVSQQEALREISPYIKDPRYLRTGREFGNFSLRPREVLGNWLVCAAVNHERNDEQVTFTTDPTGGDGLLIDTGAGKTFYTEHVFVRKQPDDCDDDVEALIANAVAHKSKHGRAYGSGKVLVIFSEATGRWFPNRVAREITGVHPFSQIWVLHLKGVVHDKYTYLVSLLDISGGDAPVWRIRISPDFSSWNVFPIT